MPGKSIASSYENACFARENLGSHEPPAKPARQILEGYVKGGVVHLLEGELPDGIFVKVIRE